VIAVIWMKVKGVAMDHQMNPVVLLTDAEERMALPIWVGPAEAQAIALQLQGVTPPRPMTHDLLRSFLREMSVSLTRVVVTDVRDQTYFAEIHLKRDGTDHALDSRPSDAIALALRMEAPIFVDERVAAQAIPLKKQEEVDMDEWRRFLDNVKPADFKRSLH
jgi:bifunctional DNase/RNase